MSSILRNFKGIKKEILMYLTYMHGYVSETEIRGFAKLTKRKFDSVKLALRELDVQNCIEEKYHYARESEVRLCPEHFFAAAVDMLKCEEEALNLLKTNYPRRSLTADFLWHIAEMLAGARPMGSVGGRLPEKEGPDLLFHINDEGILDEYVLKFSLEDFNRYMAMMLNKHLYNDLRPQDGYWERMENLLTGFSPGSRFDATPLMNRLYLDRFLFTGKLLPLPKGYTADFHRLAAEAILELYAGRYEQSSEMFIEALKQRNKISDDKNIFTHPVLAVYLILAYLKTNSAKTVQKMDQFCRKKAVVENQLLRPAYFAARFLGRPLDLSRYSWEFTSLTDDHRFQIVRDFGAILCGYYGTGVPAGIIPDCAILRHEISPYIDLPAGEKQRLEELFGGKPIIGNIYKKEEWEVVLDNLGTMLDKSGSNSPETEGKTERIAYFLYPKGGYIEVKLQNILKNGNWSIGKKVNFRDFRGLQIPAMDETDKAVAQSAPRSYWDTNLDCRSALPHLIGCDRVFNGTSTPCKKVSVVSDKPYLSIQKKKNSLVVSSNFPLKEMDQKTAILWDGKQNKASIIRISPLQAQIIKTLLALPELPLNAEGRLKELLNTVSAHIEVHSDLIEGGSSLETVSGDSKLHLRITPEQDIYRLKLYTLPLPDGQLTFFPGSGDRNIYDEAGGKRFQVKRKLSEEQRLLEQLGDFLCDSTGLQEIAEIISLEAGDMLKLTQWIQEQPDGYVMEWPENKKIRIAPVSRSAISVHSVSGEKWFEAEGEISYGTDGSISLEKLLALISSGEMDGNYIRLSDDTFLSLTDMLKKQLKRLGNIAQTGKDGVRISKFNVGQLAEVVHSGQMDVVSDNSIEELEGRIREASRLEVPVPEGLNATLRDYQVDGFRWIARLDHWGAGACLADDMGLGKTLQAIAFMLRKATDGPSLVLAPASVVMNWKKEFARFAPGMEVRVLNEEADRQEVVDSAGPSSVVIASYGLLAHNEGVVTGKEWNVVCLDEAHTIKNRMTRTSASAMQLKSSSRLILTGTPVQNYLGELWNLLQFLNPGLLGTFEQFSRKFISADKKETLKRMVQPFILRRTKAEVLDELPEKTDIIRTVKLSDPEMLCYEKMRQRVENELEEEDKVNVSVLAEITRLRQAACSVALTDKGWKGESAKLKEVRSLVEEIVSGGNRVLIFSQFTSFLEMVGSTLEQAGLEYFYLNGSTPIPQRTRMVSAFQKNEKKIFVISLKAGGLGLNLTGANYVIHLDPWWNPAIEQQATDRAYRIGQKQNVTVYHLISEHTIEEKILRLHDKKRKLADDILEGTSTASSISMEELRELCARG